jgi:RNA polymerase-binding transcription factor DksA
MSGKDFSEFEKLLLAERERLVRELDHLDGAYLENLKESSGDLSAYSLHLADLGSDAFEREMNFLRSTAEGKLLFETMDALRRLYRGEYAICESCGKRISRKRLLAMPQARLCLRCKTQEERKPH